MIPEITVQQLRAMRERKELIFLLDVRHEDEWCIARMAGATLIPLHELPHQVPHILEVIGDRKVVVYCHHGNRSKVGTAILREAGVEAFSLKGGIDEWSASVDPSLPRY